jgi:hypothetical protein
MAAEVVPGGTGDAKDVDAPMGREAFVFNGDDGLAKDGSEVVVVNDFAAFQSERADDAAFNVVKFGGGGRPKALKVVDLRQIDGINECETGKRAGDDGEREQGSEREPAGELAAVARGREKDLGAALPGGCSGFRTLWGRGCQANGPRGISTLLKMKRCASSRLALWQLKKPSGIPLGNHAV